MITFKYVSQEQLATHKNKIAYILEQIDAHKILIIQGRLSSQDETQLIKETMTHLSRKFSHDNLHSSGIEIGVLSNPPKTLWQKYTQKIIPTGMTLIGPADIIHELEQDPEQIHITFR